MSCCRQYQRRLWLEAYEELASEERSDLMRHLAGCSGCREEWNALVDFVDQAAETHSISVLTSEESERLTKNILLTLDSLNSRRAWWRRHLGFFGAASVWARVAAVCVIIVIGGLWVWKDMAPPVRTAAVSSSEEQALVKDLEVIENLELLEDFDELEKIVQMADPSVGKEGYPKIERTTGKEGARGEKRRRDAV